MKTRTRPTRRPAAPRSFGAYVAGQLVQQIAPAAGSIALAALYGFVKGVSSASDEVEVDHNGIPTMLNAHTVAVAPVIEEMMFRAPVIEGMLPAWASAGAFAAAHMPGENLRGMAAVARFADTFGGGMLYSRAAMASGLPGAVLAHAAHNLAVGLGVMLRRRRK